MAARTLPVALTLLHSREMTEAEEESAALLLHDVRLQLRRQAARKVRLALEIGVRSLAEQTPDEIREQLGLTAVEYLAGVESLREAMRGITSALS